MKKYFKFKKKGFTLIEILTVVVILGVLSTIVVSSIQKARLSAKNASIVSTISTLHAIIDVNKYPESLIDLCFDFEPGGEFAEIRTAVESQGGIWNCDSTDTQYRIFVKLNQSVVIAKNPTQIAYAQEDNSNLHAFGNYYCVNSDFESNFTHWSGKNLLYPSCLDFDYTDVIQDPVENPDPTPDPDPESDPEPPGGGDDDFDDDGQDNTVDNDDDNDGQNDNVDNDDDNDGQNDNVDNDDDNDGIEDDEDDDNDEGEVSCGKKKVKVCHFDQVICVSEKGWQNGHRKHGDKLGSC